VINPWAHGTTSWTPGTFALNASEATSSTSDLPLDNDQPSRSLYAGCEPTENGGRSDKPACQTAGERTGVAPECHTETSI
jgi:hypothetical protein